MTPTTAGTRLSSRAPGRRATGPARRPGLRLRVHGVVVATALVTLIAGVAVRESSPRSALVGIEAARALVAGDRVELTAEVVSRRFGPTRAEVQWVLAPVGAPAPWAAREFESAVRSFTLDSGERRTVSWSENTALAPGTYELTLFSRGEFDGAMVPSATQRLREPRVRVVERIGGASVLRLRSPWRDEIESVRIDRLPPSTGPERARVAARIAAGSGRPLSVAWALMDDPGDLSQWWQQPQRVQGDERRVDLDARGRAEVAFTAAFPSVGSRPLIRMSLLRGREVVDELLVVDRPLGRDSEPRRVAAVRVSGPVVLADVSMGPGDGNRDVPTVRLENVLDSERRAQVFWVLAPPNVNRPWEHGSAISAPTASRLAPVSAAIVALEPVPAERRGDVEISVWVHLAAPDGSLVHSDGVRAAVADLVDRPPDQSRGRGR